MTGLYERLLDEITDFNYGKHTHAYKVFGCQYVEENGVFGHRFTVWAPRAKYVFLVGDFNDWNPEPMEPIFESGAWTIFKDNVYEGQNYKYLIETQRGDRIYKIDPFATQFETPPKDASRVTSPHHFEWEDNNWMRQRKQTNFFENQINIYELHLTSWRRHYDGRTYSFDDLIESLIPYAKDMGYTHIEIMPIMEHPLEASWGYQITGYFGVASRYGDSQGFKRFVNACHKEGIGVLLDWVPGHFCQNLEAMAYFDGTPTFEYENPIRAVNKRWGSLNFDLGKNQVRSFLLSSAFYWLEEFHVDGIRVDAVSNMLYLDYDLEPHVLNDDGTNTNHMGIEFLRILNRTVHEAFPGIIMVAEESTSWEGITAPEEEGGLGFDYKWNMGWMNDTLRFMEMDSIYRSYHFNLLTFVFIYMHKERYILPFSHDEVVHGKKSLLGKMPGDRYNQFAQLRLLYGLMITIPGKTLNFMGNELGQFLEWRYYSELEWKDLGFQFNSEYNHYVKTLNEFVKNNDAMYKYDHVKEGIEVIDVEDQEARMSIKRIGDNTECYIILNFLPVERKGYRLGVDEPGVYVNTLNSELQEFGGSWSTPLPDMTSELIPTHGKENSIELTIPSYGFVVVQRKEMAK